LANEHVTHELSGTKVNHLIARCWLADIHMAGVDRDRYDPSDSRIGRHCVDNYHPFCLACLKIDLISNSQLSAMIAVPDIEVAQLGFLGAQLVNRSSRAQELEELS
jgi:hypothetical protein